MLLLDKTGTITFGNRMADAFEPVPGIHEITLAEAAYLASLADETPEGKSIVDLASRKFGLTPGRTRETASFVPFTAQTRMSGVDLAEGSSIRKGASDTIIAMLGGRVDPALEGIVRRIASTGGTPIVVARTARHWAWCT